MREIVSPSRKSDSSAGLSIDGVGGLLNTWTSTPAESVWPSGSSTVTTAWYVPAFA